MLEYAYAGRWSKKSVICGSGTRKKRKELYRAVIELVTNRLRR
jgi:hypothetical protein